MRPENTILLDDDSDTSEDQVEVKKIKGKSAASPSTSTARKSSKTSSNHIPTGVSVTASKFYKEANENEYKKAHALLEMSAEMKEANKIKKIKIQIQKEQTEAIKNLSQSVKALADKFTQQQ